ncbi:MAG: tetratricopeptide repeat protein [Cyclobacteriaceae bacterium]|nr:tetratricopeptide repeat protein [Cyclobacteriaceae bacterium]
MRVQNFLNTQWKALAVVALTLFYISATAQPTAAKKDTTIILISDITMQIEISQALNDLYNFKFEKAEQQFRWFKQKYKWHPLPYFLLGLSEWWKIMPNTKATTYDEQFLAYMDSTIMVGENLYKKYPQYKIESAFFLAAAHGFKGRLYSDEERKSWRKAAVEGKSALNYMEVCREMDHLSPELLFGDALYNYFSVWVPENYPALKPLLWFFRKGDKKLGLQQLREVSYNAFYTRTEAMVWLMRISNSYENDQVRAFQIAEYLYTTYPDNPYFHRYYARMLYARGQYVLLEKQATQILDRIDSAQVGYEATSGRYAAFFLGQMYEFQHKLDESKKYYELAVKFAEEVGATESGYYLFSLIALGEINQKQGNKAEAKRYFTEVKKRSGRKDEAYKDAKKRLKNLEKGD